MSKNLRMKRKRDRKRLLRLRLKHLHVIDATCQNNIIEEHHSLSSWTKNLYCPDVLIGVVVRGQIQLSGGKNVTIFVNLSDLTCWYTTTVDGKLNLSTLANPDPSIIEKIVQRYPMYERR